MSYDHCRLERCVPVRTRMWRVCFANTLAAILAAIFSYLLHESPVPSPQTNTMIKPEHLALLPQTREEQRTGTFQYFTVKGSRIVLNARENDLYQIFVQHGETGPTEEHQAMWGKIVTAFQSSPIDQVKPFRYEALPTLSSIRLVQVTQSAEDGMIHLATRTYDLNESMPQYDCLSYTWGNPHARLSMIDFHAQNEKKYDPSILWPVICDGKLLYVRRNLYDALRHMPEKRFSDMVAATSEDQLNDYKAQVVLLQFVWLDQLWVDSF